MKLKDALQTYLEVCYLDLNGVNNTGGMRDPELLKEVDKKHCGGAGDGGGAPTTVLVPRG
mgnify:CR=1 FL=1